MPRNSTAQTARVIGMSILFSAASASIEALAAGKRIDMPITRAVCAVLFRGTSPREAVQELLARDPREEA